ncbi:MAG: hypothetical protein EXR71_04275 [Myxococcales bacterium]|nr:hypothetical protein [Myxococcales bacterium]
MGVTVRWDETGPGHVTYMVLSRLGDITGDGYDDVGFGAAAEPESALMATLSGPFGAGPVLDLTTEWDTLLYSTSIEADASKGTGLGDWNGDGNNDLTVADPQFITDATMSTGYCDDNPANCYMGAVFFLAGPIAAGAIDLHAQADRLEGTYPQGEFGRSLASGGDLDGDGFPDLAVGAPSGNDATHEGKGIVYVLFGGGCP